MQKEEPTFHPISKAVAILDVSIGMLDSSKEQLELMRKIKDKPHILNDELVNRSLKLYTAQNEDSDVFLQQCAIWRKDDLTEIQLYQVQEIEKAIDDLINTNNQILSIVNACKDSTIDKLLAKDDMELGLEMLMENITLSK